MSELDEGDHERSAVVRGVQESQNNLGGPELCFQTKRKRAEGYEDRIDWPDDGGACLDDELDEKDIGALKRLYPGRRQIHGQPLEKEMACERPLQVSRTGSVSTGELHPHPTSEQDGSSREGLYTTGHSRGHGSAPSSSSTTTACPTRQQSSTSTVSYSDPAERRDLVFQQGGGSGGALRVMATKDCAQDADLNSEFCTEHVDATSRPGHSVSRAPVDTRYDEKSPGRIDYSYAATCDGHGDQAQPGIRRETVDLEQASLPKATLTGESLTSVTRPVQESQAYGGHPPLCEGSPDWQVIVQGLPENISHESLRAYFESGVSSGGTLSEFHVAQEEKTAFLVFTNESDAAKVCQDDHVFHGHPLTVSRITAEGHAMDLEPHIQTMPAITETPAYSSDRINSTVLARPREGSDEFHSAVKVTSAQPAPSCATDQNSSGSRKRSGNGDAGMFFNNEVSDPVNPGVAKRPCSREHDLSSSSLQGDPSSTEQVTVTKIFVSGFSEDVTKEKLELYFDNRKRSGGEGMIEVVMGPLFGQAVVSYASENVARRVCSQEHHLGNCALTVSLYDEEIVNEGEESSRRVIVSGLSTNIDKEYLELFFENEKHSGGGEITNIKVHSEHERAVILFADKSSARRVCSRSHSLKGHDVEVLAYSRDLDPDFAPELQPCTVEVSFPGNVVDEETLEMYFESHKHSGGGEISEICVKRLAKCAFVTFKDPQVAAQVAKRCHTLQSSILETKLCSVKGVCGAASSSMSDFETNKLLILNIPQKATEELLKMYVVAQVKVDVENLEVRRENSRALVVLAKPFDFLSAAEQVKKTPLSGNTVCLRRVQVSRTLRLTNAAQAKLTEEFIRLYFESKGHMVTVTFSGDHADITFTSPKAAETVCREKHSLNGVELNLCPIVAGWDFEFPEEQEEENSSQDKEAQTAPIQPFLLEESEELLKFLKTTPNFRTKLERQLSATKAAINNICRSTLCIQPAQGARKVLGWKKKARAVCQRFFGDLRHEKIDVPREERTVLIENDELVKQLASLKNCLSYQLNRHDRIVSFTGPDDAVQQAKEVLSKVLAEIKDGLQHPDRRKHKVKPDHMRLMEKSKFFDKLQRRYRHTKFQPDREQGHVVLDSPRFEIRSAIDDIIKKSSEMCHFDVDFQAPPVNCLMISDDGMRYAQKFVDEKCLEAVVVKKPEPSPCLRFVGWNSDAALLKTAKDTLCGKVVEEAYKLRPCEQEALQNRKWEQVLHKVQKKYLVHLQPSQGSSADRVTMLGLREHMEGVRKLLAAYFSENAVLADQLKLKKGQVRFLQTYKRGDINSIKRQHQELQVDIQLETDSLRIRGTEKGVQLAMDGCRILIKKVAQDNMEITRPGMKKYFAKAEAKKQLSEIEKSHHVIIEQDQILPAGASHAQSRTGNKNQELVVTAVLQSGMKLSIYRGDITRHSCDAMVNAANEMLNHVGGVAQAIVKAGGKEIQDECHKHVFNNGKLLVGDVFVSKAGKLPCKRVIHTVGPSWSGGKKNENRYLLHAIKNSLQAALDVTSIAFPAISTGIFGFPVQLAVEVMVNAVLEFSSAVGANFQLRNVHFVDQSEKVISAFQNVMSDIFQGAEGQLIWPEQAGLASREGAYRHVGQCGSMTSGLQHIPMTNTAQVSANTVTTAEGKVVTVVQGDLSTERADVIVNTAATNLNLHHGTVAKVLSRAAGAGLQDECSAYVRQRGDLAAGSFAVTGGHQLQCKKVYHLVVCNYDNGDGVQMLEDGLVAVFAKANQQGLRSIALPAIGTGNLGFPAKASARSMFHAVETFSRLNPSGSLCNFRFVIFDRQVVADFFVIASLRNPSCRAARNMDDLRGCDEILAEEGGGYLKYTPSERRVAAAEAYQARTAIFEKEGGILRGTVPAQQLQIHLLQGDIVKERTDAIVITANPQLKLNTGAVSKAVARVGGKNLQDECSSLAGRLRLKTGHVCSTSAGHLPCKHIIHAIVGNNNSQKSMWELQDVVLAALEEADKLRLRSVSIPALGTGLMLRYPVEDAAKAILRSVCSFASQARYVSTVRLVIFEKDNLHAFEKEFKKVLSGVQVSPAIEAGVATKVGQMIGLSSMENPHPSVTSKSATAMVPMIESPLWLRFYGPSAAAVKDAMKHVTELQINQHRAKVIENESIGDMTQNDEARVHQLADEFGVEVAIERGPINRVRVCGDVISVSDALSKIHEIISNAADAARIERNADIAAQVVEWVRLKNGIEEPYDKHNNFKLEDAYQANKSSVDLIVNGTQVTVDLNKMEQRSGRRRCPVERIDLSKPEKVPSFWDPQLGQKCRHVTLQPSDSEYKKVEQKFHQTSSRKITKIERIQNPELYQQYIAKRDSMDNAPSTKYGANEMRLYHGSDPSTILKICTQGFNRSFSGRNAILHGRGVYFAQDASYSERFSTKNAPQGVQQGTVIDLQMIQALVLVGEYCKGTNTMIAPSPRAGTNNTLDLCDSTVDNTSQPSIFVTYSDAQTYPEYVITFQ